MKLKNLMKKIETANEIAECVGSHRVYAYIVVDGLTLGDWGDSQHFYDWNHVAAAFADEYVEGVLIDVANENLCRDHVNSWKIYGKTANITIELHQERN